MTDAAPPDRPAAATNGDARTIRTIIGTGIGLATLLLMLAGLIIQQNSAANANVNARIDDVHARFDDVNARFDDVNARIDDINGRIDRVDARFDDLQKDVRELRTLIIDAIRGADPAE